MLGNLYRKYLKHFSFFFSYLRYRIFVNMGLNITVGLLDGFGLVMFIPLLKMVDFENPEFTGDLGNLNFLIDGFSLLGLRINLPNVLLVMLLFFVLKGFARFAESYYKSIVQNFLIKKLRIQSLRKLNNLSYQFFVSSDSGRIQNTLSGEVARVTAASSAYFTTLQSGIMVTVYAGLAFLANPKFAVMVIIGGLVSNVVFNVINKKTVDASRKITRDGHDFQGLLIQKVAFFKYLKATGFNTTYTNKLEEIVEKMNKTNIQIGYYGALLGAFREPMVMLVVVVMIFIQTMVFGEGLGLIILSLLFFYRALTYLMSLQAYYNSFLTSSGALENFQSFLEELESGKDSDEGIEIQGFRESILVKDLSFNYGKTIVLKNIHLKVKKNESIAIVGESGSGKTTLVNLLSGLLKADSGSIYLDGIDYRDLKTSGFQKRIGYITQEPVIFSDSIYNNVSLWSEKSPQNIKRFWESLEKAKIADFVRTLPEGEDSPLGSNGVLVSGGQKQRISIARELFKEIDILVMDEATSALDSETERNIQENIDLLRGNYTLIIVAHRLATIRNVDKVVLLSEGMIEGIDGFDDLVLSSAKFKRMVSLQNF